jgi:hypothetical protein
LPSGSSFVSIDIAKPWYEFAAFRGQRCAGTSMDTDNSCQPKPRDDSDRLLDASANHPKQQKPLN